MMDDDNHKNGGTAAADAALWAAAVCDVGRFDGENVYVFRFDYALWLMCGVSAVFCPD